MKKCKKTFISVVACISVCIPVFISCQTQKSKVKDPIVQVGQTVIGNASFEAFQKAARIYPSRSQPYYFPAQRSAVTFMAEAEAIWQYSKSKEISEKVTSSRDWVWKQRYYNAMPFVELISSESFGFTDNELKAYYNKNKEEFRVTRQDAEGQDSSFIPSFEDIKRHVADNLFYSKYKPDSAFIAKLGEQGQDSVSLRNHWMYYTRSNPGDFYMRRMFFERNGEVYDSIQQIYSPDGTMPIVSEDIDAIRAWSPPRNLRIPDLIEWLYRWKVFAERAEQMGLTNTAEHKDMLHWVLRIEYAEMYLREEVLPKAPEVTGQNYLTGLTELIIFDQARQVENIDRRRLQEEFDRIGRARTMVVIDSMIYDIRQSVGITFLQEEHKDSKSADFAELMAKADALKESAASMMHSNADEILKEAEDLYRIIATEFAFTAEGRRAMSEIAKMQIDRYNAGTRQERLLMSAIASYRRGQVLETDMETLCNSIFMVGFTFDEYLKNYPLAEANYRWILRHTPDCALAQDAEFMLLHLGEPMTSIEEIQGQSLRQGRKVDFEEELE